MVIAILARLKDCRGTWGRLMLRILIITALLLSCTWSTLSLASGVAASHTTRPSEHTSKHQTAEAALPHKASLKLLQTLHNIALKRHQYVSDQQQYLRQDHWEASLLGDCEDYALWLQQKLSLLAISSELVWVWQQNQSHMVLLVDDYYVIDNLQKHVMTLAEVNAEHPYQRIFGKWQLRDGEQKFLAQDYL